MPDLHLLKKIENGERDFPCSELSPVGKTGEENDLSGEERAWVESVRHLVLQFDSGLPLLPAERHH